MKELYHRDDPDTSRHAIENLDASGGREGHAKAVLEAVKNHPGKTAPELMMLCELDEYQVRRRLTDLKNANLVVRGDARRCQVKGTRMVTWEVPSKKRQQYLI